MANIIVYPPRNPPPSTPAPQYDPGASLDDHPCTGPHCLSIHDQLVLLVWLLAAWTSGGTPAELEIATKRFRNISLHDGLQFLIEAFPDATIEAVTSDDLKCLKCYSNQKLFEMLLYLVKLLLQVP